MNTLPKEIAWLIVSEHLPLTDALNCLGTSKFFWCKMSLQICHTKLVASNIRRKQERYVRQALELIKNLRCVFCLYQHCVTFTHCKNCSGKNPTFNVSQICEICNAPVPMLNGSPHFYATRRYINNCPAEIRKCPYKGLKFPLYFPEPCEKEPECGQAMRRHVIECSLRTCKLCNEKVKAFNMVLHASGSCPAFCRYFGKTVPTRRKIFDKSD